MIESDRSSWFIIESSTILMFVDIRIGRLETSFVCYFGLHQQPLMRECKCSMRTVPRPKCVATVYDVSQSNVVCTCIILKREERLTLVSLCSLPWSKVYFRQRNKIQRNTENTNARRYCVYCAVGKCGTDRIRINQTCMYTDWWYPSLRSWIDAVKLTRESGALFKSAVPLIQAEIVH